MLRRISLSLLAATAIGVVTFQGASAADMGMPVKAAPVAPPIPMFNWTGLYAGGFFGAGLSRNQFSSPGSIATFEGTCEGTTSFGSPFSSPCAGGAGNMGSHTGVGPLGGFTLGYRYQGAGSPIVWGIEGQFAFADIKGSNSIGSSQFTEGFCPGMLGGNNACQNTSIRNSLISSQVKDIATIAGTFGLTSGPQDRTLWFVKGGAAWARTNFSQADNITSQAHISGCSGICFLGEGAGTNINSFTSGNASRWGWMVGTGVEFGLWGNWSAKIEYDYLNFGSFDVAMGGNATWSTFPAVCCGNSGSSPFTQSLHVNEQIHMVQVGLNYKFDWGGGKGVWH